MRNVIFGDWRAATVYRQPKTNFPRELIGPLTFKLCPAIYDVRGRNEQMNRRRRALRYNLFERYSLREFRREITRVHKYYNTTDEFQYSRLSGNIIRRRGPDSHLGCRVGAASRTSDFRV